MEHRTRRNLTLINLISDFESKFDQGILDYMDEKTLNQLIEYYEGELIYDKALEVVDIALEQYAYRSEFYITKARILINDYKLELGLQFLNKAELIAPYERDIAILKIKAYSMQKKFEMAKILIDDLKGCAMKDDLVDLLIAESYYHEYNRDFSMMYEILKKSLMHDYTNREALERFLLSVELSKEYEDSILFNKRLIDVHPYNHIAWYNLGLSYCGIWEYEKAIDALEYSFIIDPKFENGYLECAEVCIQENLFEKALDIFQDYESVFGKEQDMMISMASCLIKLDKAVEAKIILLECLKMDNHNDEIYYLLGECFSKNSNWYSAINSYIKAIEIDENREEYYLSLAKGYVEIEEYNKATECFIHACDICPEDAHYWIEYVSFIIKMGLLDEAYLILDEADTHTYDTSLLYAKCVVLFNEGNKKAALRVLEDALNENFGGHHLIFELAPELELDHDIKSMIKYFYLENDL